MSEIDDADSTSDVTRLKHKVYEATYRCVCGNNFKMGWFADPEEMHKRILSKCCNTNRQQALLVGYERLDSPTWDQIMNAHTSDTIQKVPADD